MNKLVVFAGVLLIAAVVYVGAQKPDHQAACAEHHGDCDACLKFANTTLDQGGRCYFCKKNSSGAEDQCLALGFSLIQAQGDCPALNYNVGICQVTALVWIILIVIVVIIAFVCCCTFTCLCCCWCHRRRQRHREVEEENYLQEKDSIRQKSSDRRAERKAKNDEIRKKYVFLCYMDIALFHKFFPWWGALICEALTMIQQVHTNALTSDTSE